MANSEVTHQSLQRISHDPPRIKNPLRGPPEPLPDLNFAGWCRAFPRPKSGTWGTRQSSFTRKCFATGEGHHSLACLRRRGTPGPPRLEFGGLGVALFHVQKRDPSTVVRTGYGASAPFNRPYGTVCVVGGQLTQDVALRAPAWAIFRSPSGRAPSLWALSACWRKRNRSRSFAHHPQTERRLGARSLRMTPRLW